MTGGEKVIALVAIIEVLMQSAPIKTWVVEDSGEKCDGNE
jgi:hypothetical protein